MALSRVEVLEEVVLSCMTHAMTTEVEEIMGLLLGDTQPDASGGLVCRIWMAYPQIRTDRRKDRVETSPEQMARCSAHAERLSRETGLRTRVVGWYHSHPHITVLPSHVDVRTQAMYQMLDEGFAGLIFSTFNQDAASREGRVQVTAFQSVPAGSAAAAGAGPGAASGGALEAWGSAELAGLDSATKMALRASVQADAAPAAGGLVRREVPLKVVAPRSSLERSLHDFVTVQRILALEEREAYTAALAAASQLGAQQGAPPTASASTSTGTAAAGPGAQPVGQAPLRALARLHHASAYQQCLAQMVEAVLAPAVAAMRGALWQQQVQAQQLAARNAQLKALVEGARARKAAQAAAAAAAHHDTGAGSQRPARPPAPVADLLSGLSLVSTSAPAAASASTGSTAHTPALSAQHSGSTPSASYQSATSGQLHTPQATSPYASPGPKADIVTHYRPPLGPVSTPSAMSGPGSQPGSSGGQLGMLAAAASGSPLAAAAPAHASAVSPQPGSPAVAVIPHAPATPVHTKPGAHVQPPVAQAQPPHAGLPAAWVAGPGAGAEGGGDGAASSAQGSSTGSQLDLI